MTTVIGGSSPSITFSDSTTQSTAALPLTGGQLSGNLTFATGTNGIVFNNSSAAINSTLNDYETGTWTPIAGPAGGSLTSYTSTGYYVKVGQMIYINGQITITNAGTASGILNLSGLPFTIGGNSNASKGQITFTVRESAYTGTTYIGWFAGGATTGNISGNSGVAIAWSNNYTYPFQFTYQATF